MAWRLIMVIAVAMCQQQELVKQADDLDEMVRPSTHLVYFKLDGTDP